MDVGAVRPDLSPIVTGMAEPTPKGTNVGAPHHMNRLPAAGTMHAQMPTVTACPRQPTASMRGVGAQPTPKDTTAGAPHEMKRLPAAGAVPMPMPNSNPKWNSAAKPRRAVARSVGQQPTPRNAAAEAPPPQK